MQKSALNQIFLELKRSLYEVKKLTGCRPRSHIYKLDLETALHLNAGRHSLLS